MTEGDNRNRLDAMLKIGLDAYCKSWRISAEGLRELIELYGLEPNNNHCDDCHFFLRACYNGNFTEGIIRCLLEYFPDAANATDEDGMTPLHCACDNKSATLNIIKLLIDAAPESVRSEDNVGNIALHYLCENNENEVDETNAFQILKFLLDKHSEGVRHISTTNHGALPIHIAAHRRSPDFCRVLIEAYPGSDRIADGNGVLPLHYACFKGSLETVEYLYSLYPEAIHHVSPGGYPIHAVIAGTQFRRNPSVAVEVVQFLLNRDPNQKQFDGESLFESACWGDYDDSNIKAAIQVIKILFDVQPEAIEENRIASNIHRCHQQVQAFINGELVYARQAKDLRLMTTPDDNGQPPLHVALQNNVRPGSIKLLVKGNPAAILSPDNSGALPLHSACQHHDSASVVNYLVELDPSTLTLWIMMGTQLFISLAAVLSMR